MKNKLLYHKHTITAGAILMLVFAMASCENQAGADLEGLKNERDSLKTVRESADMRISELDSLIAEMDSTVERMLITTYATDTNTFRHYFEVYGNVESDRTANLIADNPGMVRQILVNEGQDVKKGQLLVRLDAEVFDRNLAELQTSLELAKTLFEKQKRLWDQNIGSEVQFLEAKNRKEGLENSIATLQEQKDRSDIRAPFDGVVDKIFLKLGEMAGMQTPVARVMNLDDLYINADVSERYLGKLKNGDEVKVIINQNDTIDSEISRVGNFINPNNRSFEIRIDVAEKMQSIKPNSLAVVKINDYSQQDAITVPSSLIMQDGKGRDYIFVVEKDHNQRDVAKKILIKSGMSYQGKTVIAEGITGQERIIDKGSRSVRDGDLVEEVNI